MKGWGVLTWLDSVGSMAETFLVACRGIDTWDGKLDPRGGTEKKNGTWASEVADGIPSIPQRRGPRIKYINHSKRPYLCITDLGFGLVHTLQSSQGLMQLIYSIFNRR